MGQLTWVLKESGVTRSESMNWCWHEGFQEDHGDLAGSYKQSVTSSTLALFFQHPQLLHPAAASPLSSLKVLLVPWPLIFCPNLPPLLGPRVSAGPPHGSAGGG